MIKSIKLSAFKGVKDMESLTFRDVNIIIGKNGGGKTTLIYAFSLLHILPQVSSEPIDLMNLSYFHDSPISEITMLDVWGSAFLLSSVYASCEEASVTFNINDEELIFRVSRAALVRKKGGSIKGLSILVIPSYNGFYNSVYRMMCRTFWSIMSRKSLVNNIVRALKDVSDIDVIKITPPMVFNEDMEPDIGVEIGSNGETIYIPFTELGSGLFRYAIVQMLIEIFDPKILVIDDVDSYLNIITLRNFLNYLFSKKSISQIVLTAQTIDPVIAAIESVDDPNIVTIAIKKGKLKYRIHNIDELEEQLEIGMDPRLLYSV